MMRSNLGIIAMHGKRADSIVQNMLLHSRGEGRSRESSDLNAILAESLDFAHQSARARDPELAVAITQDLDPAIGRLMLVPQDMSRVFLNLLSNGFYALSKRRQLADATYVPELIIKSRRLAEAAEIRFRDNGVGIPVEVKSQIFTPLFSTKPTGEGAGLGLSLSFDIIVGGHEGSIEVESAVNEFTEFIIRLPL
jgi:signal transduction histidine kinase